MFVGIPLLIAAVLGILVILLTWWFRKRKLSLFNRGLHDGYKKTFAKAKLCKNKKQLTRRIKFSIIQTNLIFRCILSREVEGLTR